MLRKAAQKGFTIVELLIVIAVIGILAVLVLNTYSGVQARARDTDRTNDITQISTQLEVYFADNGKYPTYANLHDDTWVDSTSGLKTLDLNALRAPEQITNSTVNAAAANKDQYGYEPTLAAGGACDNGVTLGDCVKFTLTYWKEQPKSTETNPIQKLSLN